MEDIQLIHGDCLVEMQNIPDKSCDLILCDLPYGITACKWDVVIPFEPLREQYNRIIKHNGAILLFGSEPFSSMIRMSNIKEYRYDWIWNKLRGTNFQLANKQPMKCHEIISVFYKSCPKYNPQMRCGKPYRCNSGIRKHKIKGLGYSSASIYRSETVSNGTRYPLSIIDFKRDKEKLHSTQKPVALLEYLIKTYTDEDDLVLDNCMGSGSCGVAAMNTNRKFIGIELDENYFNIAKKRIDEAIRKKNEKTLFD